MESRGKRMLLVGLCGVLAGALLLAPALGALYALDKKENARAKKQQEHLTEAGCASPAGMREVPVRVRVQGGGAGGASVSANNYYWHASETNEVELLLLPGAHTLRASAGNREVVRRIAVEEGVPAGYDMDIRLAPDVPEYMSLEIEDGGLREVRLPAGFGPDVAVYSLPGGVELGRDADGFFLRVDTPQASPYIPLRLEVSNENGRALCFVGVRIRRQETPVAIRTVEDLYQIRDNPSGSYYLANDLDLSGAGPWRSLTDAEHPFTGVLDGKGHALYGLHMELTSQQPVASFLGWIMGAEVRNLVFVNPTVQDVTPAPGMYPGVGILAYVAEDSLIANCAVLGGVVTAEANLAGALTTAGKNCHYMNLFNSADILLGNRAFLPSASGICGAPSGSYFTRCANEGTLQGHHLTGGITGYGSDFAISQSINSGQIRCIPLASTLLPGGINQSSTDSFKYDCYYVARQSPVGTGGTGPASRVLPVTWEELKMPDALPLLGEFSGEDAGWGYASLNALGPVPLGIFNRVAPAPSPVIENATIALAAQDGVVYVYTLDGSNPRINGTMAESLEITLTGRGQLRVFCASDRAYDSETVTITAQGVET